jgi:hypothetical protein
MSSHAAIITSQLQSTLTKLQLQTHPLVQTTGQLILTCQKVEWHFDPENKITRIFSRTKKISVYGYQNIIPIIIGSKASNHYLYTTSNLYKELNKFNV